MDLVVNAQRRRVLVVLPEPVDDRLERLTRAALAAQVQVSRSQLLAALIATAPTQPQGLAAVVRDYLAQELEAFSRGHPDKDLPQVRHPGARRGSAHWRNRSAGAS